MAPLLFTNAALLAGLFALAIPVLLHLLIRRKKQRMRFSTLQFFLKQDEKSGRRHKLRQWLLLTARLLLVALIVLAFARPYWQADAAAPTATQRRNIVFVIDRSASMMAADAGVSRWTKAKEIIGQTLAELSWNDRVAVVECATPSANLLPLMPPEKMKTELDQLAPGYGGGELGEALQAAARVLSAKDVSGQLSLYVVSDLQRQSCRNIAAATVSKDIELKVFSVGNADLPNRAVLDLNLSAAGARPLNAEVADFTINEKGGETKLDWVIDGIASPASSISLKAGASVPVTSPLPEMKPGWHRVEARLAAADHFPSDDVRYLTVNIPTPLRVLCVETRPGEHAFAAESFFIMNALQPGVSISNALPTLFKVEKVSLADAAAIFGDYERLAQYQLLLLPALRQIPGGTGQALLEFVKQGGGLVMWLGDNLSGNQYNAEFGDLLPAGVSQSQGGARPFESARHLSEVDFDSPVFSIFHQPDSGDVSLPEFTRCCALEPLETARVLARFNDATPFLVTRNVGAGQVALVNTSADTSWSDWPKRKTFVPWMHSLCHYVSRTTGGLAIQTEKAWAANTLANLETIPANAGKTFQVRSPNGVASPVVLDERGDFSVRLSQPGFYAITDAKGQLVRQLAVNLPSSESDLAGLTPVEFEQQIVRSDPAAESGLVAALFDSGNGDSSFWRGLMLAAAVLLLLETILANRTFA